MGISAKPVILLNARHKTDADLWRSLFQAAARILLHGKKRVFVDAIPGNANRNAPEESEAETEADNWVRDFLIPNSEWDKFAAAFSAARRKSGSSPRNKASPQASSWAVCNEMGCYHGAAA